MDRQLLRDPGVDYAPLIPLSRASTAPIRNIHPRFISDLEVPAENLIGDEGLGLRDIINGWNTERVLIATEPIGDGRSFVERAARYASERRAGSWR